MFIAALGTVDKTCSIFQQKQKWKKKKKKKNTLKPTVSKQGIKLLVICNGKGLKISKQSKNQLSKPSSMLAYK